MSVKQQLRRSSLELASRLRTREDQAVSAQVDTSFAGAKLITSRRGTASSRDSLSTLNSQDVNKNTVKHYQKLDISSRLFISLCGPKYLPGIKVLLAGLIATSGKGSISL
jgi:hypothetical protein